MRRWHFGLLGASLPVLALSIVLVGCSKDESKDTTPAGPKKTEPKKEMTGLEPGKGVLKGTVMLDGPPPDTKKLTDELLALVKSKNQTDFCLNGPNIPPEDKEQQEYRIKDGKVANVFVWVEPVDKKTTYFKIDDPKPYVKDLVIHQPHCAFHPHAAVVFTQYHNPKKPSEMLPTGQKITAINDATESHNTNYKGGTNNPGGNDLLKPGGTLEISVQPSTEPIKVKCDIHTWMSAYLRAFDHPYAAVTDENGNYEIKNVPTGHKLKLYVWHETAGFLNGDKGEEIDVKDGDNLHDFKLKAK